MLSTVSVDTAISFADVSGAGGVVCGGSVSTVGVVWSAVVSGAAGADVSAGISEEVVSGGFGVPVARRYVSARMSAMAT